MAVGKLSVGYVLSVNISENIFMGGVMVTDAHALPLEFRYTEPVKATKLQKVLYGDVLEKYIQCDVIAANLVNKLEQKPDLLIVSDTNLLPSLDSSRYKAIMLSGSRVAPLKEFGVQQDINDTEFYLQITDSGAPARVKLNSGDPAKKTEIARILTECGRTMDLLEPLYRVETAIKMLWEEAQATENH